MRGHGRTYVLEVEGGFVSGSEPDEYHAATMAGDGSLLLGRVAVSSEGVEGRGVELVEGRVSTKKCVWAEVHGCPTLLPVGHK